MRHLFYLDESGDLGWSFNRLFGHGSPPLHLQQPNFRGRAAAFSASEAAPAAYH